MTSTDVVKVRQAISEISKGKDVVEDGWMMMWCNTNWGDLLRLAPLSIALLGELMVIASGTKDFSLVDVTKDYESLELKHVKFPTSFKACLQQIIGEGYTAFETASKQMMRIGNASSQLPKAIKNAVDLVIANLSPEEIEVMLPVELESIDALFKICTEAARGAEQGFIPILALAQEILECLKFKAGTAEQQQTQDETHAEILEEQKKKEDKLTRATKEAADLLKKSIADAEEQFKSAVAGIPSGWEIMAMNLVETLNNAITGPINASLGMANVKAVYLQTGRSGESGRTTLPSGPALSDPGVSLAEQILGLVTGLSLLISGGPDDKPDWANIRDSGGKSGSLYVERSLKTMKDRLDLSKPISNKLLPIVEKAMEVVQKVNDIALSGDSADDTALDQHKPAVKKMMEDLQGTVTQCNLILQQTGHTVAGPATPSIPKDIQDNPRLAESATETAKSVVDQARASLEAARESHEKASARLIESQLKIKKTIEGLPKLTPESIDNIIYALTGVVKTLASIRARLSELTQLFAAAESLVNKVMHPQVSSWANKMGESSRLVLAGVKLSDFHRHAIYSQMIALLIISRHAERISSMYLRVSEKHVMPALRELGHLLLLQIDTTPQGRKEMLEKLAASQKVINDRSQAANEEIAKIIKEDQQEISGKIKVRLETIQNTVGTVLPAIREPLPREIAEVTKAHIEEVDCQKEEDQKAMPPYQVDDIL